MKYIICSQSFVYESWKQSVFTGDWSWSGARIEASRLTQRCKFYQVSSGCLERTGTPQRKTPFYPRSPYGVAKVMHIDQLSRIYDMFATTGILFNHESPRRGWNL
jgi:GDPmannose 4,6-dehydratase